MSQIESLDVFRAVLPLPTPLFVWGKVITQREFVFARVHSGNHVGTGYGLGRVAGIVDMIERHLKPIVIGRPTHDIRALWQSARASMRMIGEGGVFARALSIVDIALWDLHAQNMGVPLWQLLGGTQRGLPCIAICGYYQPDDPIGNVHRDAERLTRAGYTHFKMPVGEDVALDVKRVTALRDVVGKDAHIAVDASGSFNSVKQAHAFIRALEPLGLAFFEDPFPATHWHLSMALARATDIPIAYGESLSSPADMHRLVAGIDILRPDATHQLGITGYMQAIATAVENGIAHFPHYFPDIHAPLAAAFGAAWIEESPNEADTVGFRVLRAKQPIIQSGLWQLSDAPGLGIGWDEDAFAQFRA
jgi:L-alanine-DL-glutamate epimerase-like enolase superfamily enzyme